MLRVIKQIGRSVVNRYRKWQRRSKPLSMEQILADLDRLPIQQGEALFVHSSLSSLGFIKGDIRLIIDKLIEKVGQQGHLFMPSFSTTGYTLPYLNQPDLVWDVRHTPSAMGVLTEVFRTRYAVHRSIHPTHSVLVWGMRGAEFTASHHLDARPFAEQSPFYKFCELPQSKVLCLGMTMFPVTIFRCYETVHKDTYPLKVFLDDPVKVNVVDANGKCFSMETLVHNPEVSNTRRNLLFENFFKTAGKLVSYPIGQSTSWLLDSSDFYDTIAKEYDKGNLPYLGHYADLEKYGVDVEQLQMLKS